MVHKNMSEQRSILEQYPDYTVNIGIEVHVQLLSASKIFCACSNKVSQDANSTICPICAGHPGVLPVLNQQVVEYAVLTGLATNCTIAPVSIFDRKHYFYPDLPKNYQITQNERPICTNGYIEIRLEDGSYKKIRIKRIHMEEDAGKSIHAAQGNESFVDLNRAGTPLLEIVTQPDITNAYEARTYLKTLRLIVQYLGVCSGNMEEGAFRADTNISVRKKDSETLGTRCELKNINSFKFISDAIEYEIERQIHALQEGEKIKQETRLWDTKNHVTIPMRSKEEAADYRYFQDPDLPYIAIEQKRIELARSRMPELPNTRFNRLIKEYGLSTYEADILIDDRELTDYFQEAATYTTSKQLINWLLRDLLGYIKEHKISFADCKITPRRLAEIVGMLEQGTINNHAAKQVFEEVAASGQEPADIVKSKGLEQIGSREELEKIIQEIIATNHENVAAYKAGTTKLFGFFVGQAMAKTGGKGNPKLIQELLKKHL